MNHLTYDPLNFTLSPPAPIKEQSDGRRATALLGPSKNVLVETNMSVQTPAAARGIRERAGFAASALPTLVYRINKAFLTQIFVVPVHLTNKHRKAFVAQFLAALRESRRREAARVITLYRHLTEGDEC